MKKLLLIFSFITIFPQIFAQDYSRKPGKVSDYELKMTTYEQDTSAAAVILYKNITGEYKVTGDDLYIYSTQYRTYYTKYKILKQEGVEIANVEIPYYYEDEILDITASSYNLVNGKKVETKLSKKYIFDEQQSANYRRIKFSVPNVQVGSVVEIKYTVTFNLPENISPIRFQHKYPLVYAYAKVSIPEYYHFNTSAQGYHNITVNKGTSSSTSQYGYSVTTGTTVQDKHQGTTTLTYKQEEIECAAENVPALKDENFVWCFNDYRSAINFELLGYNFPGQVYKPVSTNWEAINRTLKESDFSSNLKILNPFKTEVATILSRTDNELERIAAIHKLVMSKIVWDERYRLIDRNMLGDVQSTVKKGNGSSAEINFILNAALTDAGFKTTQVLLNPRHFGRLPLTHPSLEKINAFIIRVTLSDGSFVYIDGTSRYSSLNVLPVSLMADRARVYGVNSNTEGWVNLTSLTQNIMQGRLMAELDTDGKLSGKVECAYSNVKAMNKKRSRYTALNEEKYIESLEEDDNIEISDYFFYDTNKNVEEKYNFSMQSNVVGDFIYLNSSIFPFMAENKLSAQERDLPIEFSYPKELIERCWFILRSLGRSYN